MARLTGQGPYAGHVSGAAHRSSTSCSAARHTARLVSPTRRALWLYPFWRVQPHPYRLPCDARQVLYLHDRQTVTKVQTPSFTQHAQGQHLLLAAIDHVGPGMCVQHHSNSASALILTSPCETERQTGSPLLPTRYGERRSLIISSDRFRLHPSLSWRQDSQHRRKAILGN